MKAMRDRFAPIVAVFLSLAVFLSASFLFAQNASSRKHFLWKVRSETATVYLLGSIHFMKKESYPLDEIIEEAFAKSSVLAVEADVTDVTKMDMGKLLDRAFYPADDSLERHVSRETYAMIEREFAGSGIVLDLLNRQRPWFLALTLTSLELMKMGYDPAYGIDAHFLSKASGKKKIVELESIDYQIDLLSGFSDREQELFLTHTIKDLGVLKEEMEPIVRAWKTGDTKTLEALLSKSSMGDKDMSAFYEKILYERNRSMASRIEGFLKSKETHFVVIGAGHLIGGKGIVELLRRKGYSVEQL